MASIGNVCSQQVPQQNGVELAKLVNGILVDLTSLKTAIGNINTKLDALGASFVIGSAGTNNVSGNTPALTTTA
jgi:hypothetical protein